MLDELTQSAKTTTTTIRLRLLDKIKKLIDDVNV